MQHRKITLLTYKQGNGSKGLCEDETTRRTVWAEVGDIRVIPIISWSDSRSFEWCFDGEPHNAVVAISTVGCERDKEAFNLFTSGYNEMLGRLKPVHILVYGKKIRFYDGEYNGH